MIREANLDDLDYIFDIELLCFKATDDNEDLEVLKSFIEEDRYRTFVATNEGKVVGYLTCEDMGNAYYVTSIAVIPEFRKLGVAGSLLNTSHEDMPIGYNMFCEIRSGNYPSQRFFEKHGFKKVNTLEKFYQDELGFYYETERKR